MADSCDCVFQDSSYLSQYCSASSGSQNGTSTLFLTLVDLLLRTSCLVADPCNRVSTGDRQKVKIEEAYDYIVVGGGTAGCVVAGRLSENPNVNVLLLETGPDEPTTSRVPGLLANIVGSPLDYSFKTEKNEKACLETGGVCTWARGRMLAGTGAFSGMLYTRPSKSLFDDWANKLQLKGWSSKEVLEFFKKSENNLNPDLVDKDEHGTGGPLTVQRFASQPLFAEDILKAAASLGYKGTDLSGANPSGLNYVQGMVDQGIRASTARMYLTKKLHQTNLRVKLNAQVEKIVFNGTRATGIVYRDLTTNETVTVKVNKEVILSGGVIGSPHLLLLSGVGPKEQLAALNINVVKDLKVGSNLLHHVSVKAEFTMNDNFLQNLNIDELVHYLTNQSGQLASNSMVQLTGFFNSTLSPLNDLQLYFDGFETWCSRTGYLRECQDGKLLNGTSDHDEFIAKLNSMKTNKNAAIIDDIVKKYEAIKGAPIAGPLPCGRRRIGVRPNNLLPLSKGQLVLRSANPSDPPKLITNYLDNEQDVKILLTGIRIAQKILSSDLLKKYDIQPDYNYPACNAYPVDSDAYWSCVIHHYTLPENHHTGTCKMGSVTDPDAVVDERLKVYGLANVRVADASVFPTQLNCNPISVVVMTAEKCSQMVLEDNKT
uniref:Glucose dehydrogenase [FAD, quinone] n=1 Tax=Cacopsylla melanoneura TaxID=428564 RepID=A0A8D8TI37_9HEMI